MGNLVQPEEEMKSVHRAPGFEREQRKKPNSSCHLLDWLEPPKDVVGLWKPPSGSSAWAQRTTPPLSGTPPAEVEEPLVRLSTLLSLEVNVRFT